MKGQYEGTPSGQDRPVVIVRFRNPHDQTIHIERRCIVDTGMSACGLPKSLLKQSLRLGLPVAGITEDADGKCTAREMWTACVELLHSESGTAEKRCGKLKVVALSEGAHPIVGRNVLNQFLVILDASNRICDIE